MQTYAVFHLAITTLRLANASQSANNLSHKFYSILSNDNDFITK